MRRLDGPHRFLLLLAAAMTLGACATDGSPATSAPTTGATAPVTAPPATSAPSARPTELPSAPTDVVTTGTTQAPSVRSVAEAQLTRPWGCWYGFAATNEARTVALVLSADAPSPVGTSTVTLPDPAWRARVDLGTDLLSVACGDQDLRRSPEPAESWPVVRGTLQITAPALPGGCGGGGAAATAVATGLTVAVPDGSMLTFPELTLTNDEWGCAAG